MRLETYKTTLNTQKYTTNSKKNSSMNVKNSLMNTKNTSHKPIYHAENTKSNQNYTQKSQEMTKK